MDICMFEKIHADSMTIRATYVKCIFPLLALTILLIIKKSQGSKKVIGRRPFSSDVLSHCFLNQTGFLELLALPNPSLRLV